MLAKFCRYHADWNEIKPQNFDVLILAFIISLIIIANISHVGQCFCNNDTIECLPMNVTFIFKKKYFVKKVKKKNWKVSGIPLRLKDIYLLLGEIGLLIWGVQEILRLVSQIFVF